LLPPLSRKTLNTLYLILIVELHAKGVREFWEKLGMEVSGATTKH
jgi:hypothetical protein